MSLFKLPSIIKNKPEPNPLSDMEQFYLNQYFRPQGAGPYQGPYPGVQQQQQPQPGFRPFGFNFGPKRMPPRFGQHMTAHEMPSEALMQQQIANQQIPHGGQPNPQFVGTPHIPQVQPAKHPVPQHPLQKPSPQQPQAMPYNQHVQPQQYTQNKPIPGFPVPKPPQNIMHPPQHVIDTVSYQQPNMQHQMQFQNQQINPLPNNHFPTQHQIVQPVTSNVETGQSTFRFPPLDPVLLKQLEHRVARIEQHLGLPTPATPKR